MNSTDRSVMELVFTGEFPPETAGIGMFMYSRCLGARPGHTHVLAADIGETAQWDASSGLSISRFPYRYGKSIPRRFEQLYRAYTALGKETKKRRYRVVCASAALPFGWAAACFKRKGHKLAIFCHDTDVTLPILSFGARDLYRFTMSACDLFIANSSITAEKLREQGWDPARIHVIHPPVDCTRFHTGVDGTALRKRMLGKKGGPLLLTVARLGEPGKGIDTVLRVLPRLLKEFPELVYVTVGSGTGLEGYLKLAAELGTADHVLFPGRVAPENLPEYYAACDAYIMVTRPVPQRRYYEGFGIAYREAMACGKPVIASSEAGIRDIIRDGENGALVNPTDIEAVYQRVRELLTNTRSAQEMGLRAVSAACRPINWGPLDALS